MKNKLLVTFALFMVLIMTGCSKEKKLTCNFVDKSDIGTVSTKQVFIFDSEGKNIKKFNVEIKYIYNDTYMKLIKSSGQSLESIIDTQSICKNYTSHEGVSCKSKVNNNELVLTVKGKVDKTEDAYYKGSYNEVKNIYSEIKYTCK